MARRVMAVVPAYNESLNIVAVIEELRATKLKGYELDFVIVDDGSKDKTRDVAVGAGAKVVSLPYNMGIGMTVQTGFRYALAHNAEFVVQVDGDGQHVPSEIEKLLAAVEKGQADVVIGTRFANGKKDGLHTTTLLRWIAGRLLSWTVRFLTGKSMTDTTSGFRLFNLKAAEFIAHNYPDDYPEVEVLVMLARQGLRMVEVPVQMRSRAFGQSSINWQRSIYYVLKVMFASFLDRVRK